MLVSTRTRRVRPLLARPSLFVGLALTWACSESPAAPPDGASPTALDALGERVFHDADLSIGKNRSCASCHDAEWGFKGSSASSRGGVFEGSIAGRFGSRTPQSAAYAPLAPVFHFSEARGGYVGGNFWDGRATGAELGSPAAEQARGPFVNPVEQALPDIACVVFRVSVASYAELYREAWGGDIGVDFPVDSDARCGVEGTTLPLSSPDRERVEQAYDRIALALAAFEASPRVSAFSSKFDAWLRGEFPAHSADPELVDPGLGGSSGAAPGPAQRGLVRTPTLRNVDRRSAAGQVKPLMHNGALLSLTEVVRYYNTRDVLPRCGSGDARSAWGVSCWPAPAVAENVNSRDMGNLGLAAFQEEAIVALLRTLDDGFGR